MSKTTSKCPKSCHTSPKKVIFKTSWTIEEFAFCEEELLESTKFCADDGRDLAWHYELSRVVNDYPRSGVNVDLRIDSSEAPSNLFLKTEVLSELNGRRANESRTLAWAGTSSNMIRLERSFLTGDELTINVEVCLVEKVECHVRDDPQIVQPASTLIPDLARLLEDQILTDVTFIVGESEFHGHKALLAARSRVFAAMFTNGMVESRQKRVVISDIEPAVFAEVLRFIYTDSVNELDSMALELLQVADRYDLGTLRTKCEGSLCANISEANAIQTLVTADLYRAEQLKRATIAFIQRNGSVFNSEEWKNLWKVNFDLANEMLVRLVLK